MATIRELFNALHSRAGIEVVEHDEKPKKLRIIGRLHRNFGDQWKVVMHRLLTAEVNAHWKVDISKKYFLKSNQLVYGYRILFDAENLSQHYDELIRLISTTPQPTRTTVEEVPLVGASANRNTRSNVGPVGSVAIGPAALHRKMMGG